MATRYWVGGGSTADWNATGNTNWGTASGVQDNASVPTSADDVIFDGAGGAGVGDSNSTISATITVKSLTITTGYTSTMTHNAGLTIAGNWTYVNTYTIAGTSGITISAASTITSNGVTWPNALTFSGTVTYTLVGNLTVGGLLNCTGNPVTVNKTTTEELILLGGVTHINLYGTVLIRLKGGTWSGGARIGADLTIDGNVTVGTTATFGGATLTYASGTVTTTGSTLVINVGSTLNTNGITWNNINIPSAVTVTLTSNLSMSGLLSGVTHMYFNKTTAETVTVAGGISIGGNSLQGTAAIYMTGGTLSSGGGYLGVSLYIQGNVTVSGTVPVSSSLTGAYIEYISGTVTTTGSTLDIRYSCTLKTSGITWNNITFSTATQTCTLTSNLTANGLVTVSAATTVNKTTAETFTIAGGLTLNADIIGTAKLILTGGTWTGNGKWTTNSVDFQGNVTVSGVVLYTSGTMTYVSGTITTTGSELHPINCTLNTSGITWNNVLCSNASGTTTLTSDLNIGGSFGIQSFTYIFNRTTAEVINVNGNFNQLHGLSGTAKIVLKGGTWTGNTPYCTSPVDLQGNVTISGAVYYGGTMNYVSGTITTTGSTFNISGATLNTTGVTWNNVTLTGGTTTLTSNLAANGLMTVSTATTLNRTTAETVTVAGGLTMTSTLGGTAKMILTGGTWSGTGTLSNTLDIQGNVTLSGTVYYGGSAFTYVSGTITTTGSTFRVTADCTITSGSITWNNVQFSGTTNTYKTKTLVGNMVLNGTFQIGAGNNEYQTVNKTTTETITANGLTISDNCGGNTDVYITGGTISNNRGYYQLASTLFLNGNITFSGTVGFLNNNCIIKYVSGTITTANSTIDIPNVTLDTSGMEWWNARAGGGSISILSDLVIRNSFTVYSGGGGEAISSSNNASIYVYNGLSTGNNFSALRGDVKIYLRGGALTCDVGYINSPIFIDGDITITTPLVYGGASYSKLTYLSGKILSYPNTINLSTCTITGLYNKMNVATVSVYANSVVTFDRLFAGTPKQICSFVSTGINYIMAFQDDFEKMGRFVSITGATLNRPLQLMIVNSPRFNTNRQTSFGMRYYNQSPNGFARNAPSISDRSLTGGFGALEADPNFVKQ